MKKPKVPTREEYLNYNGAHCANLWEQLPESWSCPGCGRSKFEILRWTTRYVKDSVRCRPYKGWMAVLHGHHDHGNNRRFDEVVVCGNCNAADAEAQKKLNIYGLFSFSPSEIRQFVKATPHSKHQIDYEKAREVFERIHSLG